MIIAIVVIVLAVGVAVAVWYRRKGSTKSNTQPGSAFENPLYDMSSASALRNQPSNAIEDTSGYMDMQPAGYNDHTGGYMEMQPAAADANEEDNGYMDVPAGAGTGVSLLDYNAMTTSLTGHVYS
jgi:hypothetical protein